MKKKEASKNIIIMSYKPYLNQDYEKLKADCLKANKLYEDDKFLANDSSLFRTTKSPGIVWKRPSEICKDPQFIVNDIAPTDLDQVKKHFCSALF